MLSYIGLDFENYLMEYIYILQRYIPFFSEKKNYFIFQLEYFAKKVNKTVWILYP